MTRSQALALLLIPAIALALGSCGSDTTTQPSTVQAHYTGADHSLISAHGLFIYQASGYSALVAVDGTTHDTLSMAIQGTDTGTFRIGPHYSSTMSLISGAHQYTSGYTGAHGTIHISSLDPRTQTVRGDFSGTLTTVIPGDSLQLSAGTMQVQYQF